MSKITGFETYKDKSQTLVNDKKTVQELTVGTGMIERSPFKVFDDHVIVRIPPVGHKLFGYDPKAVFKIGQRVYKDQPGLLVYEDDSLTPIQVHFTGSFRARPVITNDADLLRRFLVEKKFYKIAGFDKDGDPVYEPTESTAFDDPADINYKRLSGVVNSFEVLDMLAGHAWDVSHVYAETRKLQKGMSPKQIYMKVPIFTKVGDWDDVIE